jgi:hypothetical protein
MAPGVNGPLTLDAHQYYGLPVHLRDQLDAWMAAQGIPRERCWMLSLGDGYVEATLYRVDPSGKRYMTVEGEAAVEVAVVPYDAHQPPPREAFERFRGKS